MRTVLRDSYIVLFFLPDKLMQEYDALQNKTFTYTYDGNGNILSVAETGGATKIYVYGDASWGDLLTSYDGQAITYDTIGNPLSYLGATLTWTNGRRLASYTKGDTAVTYTYNADGMRTSKTVNGTVTEYIYDGSTLLAQKVGNDWMYFFYDADGILGFIYNNCAYYYAKNLQGDVLSVLDSYGLTVCEYTYDSWGKLITVTDENGDTVTDPTDVALLNPIRYRGYLYDSDTGFYYLQSRYYDPVTKRFINADGLIDNRGIGTQNMFAYCYNNPVRLTDSSGNVPDDYLKQIAQECPAGDDCGHILFRHNEKNEDYVEPKPRCEVYPIPGRKITHKHSKKTKFAVDIGAPEGTSILAPTGGVVCSNLYSSRYGNVIVIDHGNGYYTLYAHLLEKGLPVGTEVEPGMVIGKAGNTGSSSYGSHLHMELFYIDPSKLNGKDPYKYKVNDATKDDVDYFKAYKWVTVEGVW